MMDTFWNLQGVPQILWNTRTTDIENKYHVRWEISLKNLLGVPLKKVCDKTDYYFKNLIKTPLKNFYFFIRHKNVILDIQ